MHEPLALAVDLGGTKVEAALVDRHGGLVPGSRFRSPTGHASDSNQLVSAVRSAVHSATAALPSGGTISGVGVGSAGPIHYEADTVSPLNLPAWRNFPIVELIAPLVPGTSVTLRSDGLCITLAEHWMGAARGVDNLMGMVVSTGIGGGLILNGRAIVGATGNAGHIGHIQVSDIDASDSDTVCACGGRGCLEAIASGPNTVAWAQSKGWRGESGEDLSASYRTGDPLARAAIERSGRAIGHAIGSANALLELDVLTIGGGFSRVTPDLFDFIRTGLAERSSFDFARRVEVVPSALSSEGPLVGAAALVHRFELVE